MNKHISYHTPLDDSYPTCAETRATLRIYPGPMVPELVTNILQLTPTKTVTAGQELVSRSGRRRTLSTNGWFLSSEGQILSRDSRRHIDWLISRILPKAEKLRSLQSMDGVHMAVTCAWYSAAGHGGPALWPEQMEALASLNLELNFDIYFTEDDSQ